MPVIVQLGRPVVSGGILTSLYMVDYWDSPVKITETGIKMKNPEENGYVATVS